MSGELSVAEDERFATAKVADGVLLDSRLALYHETQRWLAVSDLHLGSDPRATARPEMLKLWGTPDIETRLLRLLDHYQPQRLIIAGDVMNFNGSVDDTADFIKRMADRVDLICLAGNHDHPELVQRMGMLKSHHEEGYLFHHGHRLEEMLNEPDSDAVERIHITGHSHPITTIEPLGLAVRRAPVFADTHYTGAGQGVRRWIIPAFAPWASGAWPMRKADDNRLFALMPGNVMQIA
jgi:metallophosphoesterase superfamily enzyme